MSSFNQSATGPNGSKASSGSWSSTPNAGVEQQQQQQQQPQSNLGNFYDMDWGNSLVGTPDFTNFYEPQGELLEDSSAQRAPPQEFTMLGPIGTSQGTVESGSREQINLNTSSGTSGAVRTAHSPAQNQLKRKAGSDTSGSSPGLAATPAATPTIRVEGDTHGPPQKRVTAHATESDNDDRQMSKDRPSLIRNSRKEPRRSKSSVQSLKPVYKGSPGSSRGASDGESILMTDPPGILRTIDGKPHIDIDLALPHDKVFPIQIGSELFRLSGASISSDAPSYFSEFFRQQLEENGDAAGQIRTLYIDRDPVVFRDISLHLQGYYVQPRDVAHYVKLFADAQFYNLPRLISQLFESEIFVEIGGRNFQIPRDIFSGPGDSPNFFSLGFGLFFSTPNRTFPGLERMGLLRPPSMQPPSVPNRSADTFADLIHLLRGYPLHIRDEEHRAELIRDCRYFHLRGLEQKLVPHQISFNAARARSEIVVRLEDVKPSGVSVKDDPSPPAEQIPASAWVNYARPFVDEVSYELILEIRNESMRVNLGSRRADFYGKDKARISSLFQVVANKLNLPVNQPLGLMMMSGGGVAKQPVSPGNTPLSEDLVKVQIDRHTDIRLDGEPYRIDLEQEEEDVGPSSSSHAGITPSPGWPSFTPSSRPGQSPVPRPNAAKKRRRRGSLDETGEWVIRTGQWRLRIQPCEGDARGGMELVLVAVKLDAYSGQLGRNRQRSFLSS